MPRIPTHTIDSALPRRLRGWTVWCGAWELLNIHAGMARSPVVLATYKVCSVMTSETDARMEAMA